MPYLAVNVQEYCIGLGVFLAKSKLFIINYFYSQYCTRCYANELNILLE
jgi:hypothetical protein